MFVTRLIKKVIRFTIVLSGSYLSSTNEVMSN